MQFFRNDNRIQRRTQRSKADKLGEQAGRTFLPASFHGSRAYMRRRVEDAYALAASKGARPTYFDTMTNSTLPDDR
eukprot:gene7579-2979_t